jgi:hypothetical protein
MAGGNKSNSPKVKKRKAQRQAVERTKRQHDSKRRGGFRRE